MADTTTDVRTYTDDQVSGALNRACDNIIDACDLPETGTLDALNLVVNATMTYLRDPDADLETAAGGYDAGLNEILNWIDDGGRDEDHDDETDPVDDGIDQATIDRIYGKET